MIYEKQLKNGIRLIVKKMEGLFSVSAGIMVGTGASVETDEEDGISHFIEHMQFKGTKKRSAFEISDAFDRIGAQANAFTGKDVTCYYVKCTSDHTKEAFEILSDLFLNATYPEEEMQRERGVICEEIAMNEDTPDDLCFDVLAEAIYGRKNYGRNILGSASNVKAFTIEQVNRYKKAHYTPKNIVVSFAGGIDFEEAEALTIKAFSDLMGEDAPKEEKKVAPIYKAIVRQKPIEQMHLAIGYPSLERDHPLTDALVTANNILGGGMSSRLFQEVREKLGLAYSVFSYPSAYKECGNLVVYAGVNTANALKAFEAIESVNQGILKEGISDEEFLRGREQMKSSLLFAQESTSTQMLTYGKYLLYTNKVYDFSQKLASIEKMTKGDVMNVFELLFGLGKKAIGAVGDKPIDFAL